MDIHEFAKKLNDREYGSEMTRDEIKQAKELGFVVVFGALDDLAELRGAIDDEVDCYNSGEILLDKDGIMEDCEYGLDNCKYIKKAKENAKIIKTVRDNDDYSWIYETDIPHATFDILEDGEKFCKGIVFDIKELQ